MAPRGVVTMQPPLPVRGKRRRRWDGRARGSPPPGALVPLLLHAYENGLGGFVRRRCRTRDDAEDALQETMLAALRSSGSFRGESRFGTWLHAVAVNACRRSYRRGLYDPHLTASYRWTRPRRRWYLPADRTTSPAARRRRNSNSCGRSSRRGSRTRWRGCRSTTGPWSCCATGTGGRVTQQRRPSASPVPP